MQWKESEHPRDEEGKFTEKGRASFDKSGLKFNKDGSIEFRDVFDDFDESEIDTPEELSANRIEQIKKIEPKVTKDLNEIVKANGGKLHGLDFRLKTKESLTRKVNQEIKELGISPKQAVDKMHDVLRYTSKVPTDNFVSHFKKVMDAMEKAGYKVTKIKNHFKCADSEFYRDINTNFKAPDGTIFELQFNTPEGLEVKDEAHGYYEKKRVLEKGDPLIEVYNDKMRSLWNPVPRPIGVESIEEI